MMPVLLVLLAVAAQSPAADSLRNRARTLSQAELVEEARAAPLAAREALGESLRHDDLPTARRLALAFAVAWEDSFYVREVSRVATWPPARRAARLWADSVRREGIAAYGSEGAATAIALWRRALDRAFAIADTALAAALTGNIGTGFLRDGIADSASVYLMRAVRLARVVGDRRVEANAVTALGGVREDEGDLAGARAHYLRALALHERTGDSRGLAASRNNLGLLAWATGDLAEARRQFEAALAINRRDGRDEVAATNMINLAGLASMEGDFPAAEQFYRDALAIWRGRDEEADAADALYGLGQLELRRGDYAAAREALVAARATYAVTGPPGSELGARRALAAALGAQGDLQGALDVLREAEDRARALDAGSAVAAGLTLARADLAVQLNALDEAERLYLQAGELYREAGDADGEAEAQHGRGVLLLERDDHAGAAALFETALRTQEAGGERRAAGLTRMALGEVSRARHDTVQARRHLRQALADLEAAGDPVGQAAVLGALARLEADRGLPAAAEALYRQGLTRLEGHMAPDVAWRLHAGLAHARRARGAINDAAEGLRRAMAEAEQGGRTLVVPERRAGFRADKWDVYAQLALVERERGLPAAAFELSERLRAREMLDLLGRGRIMPSDPPTGLVTREQDLRRRIAELTVEMEGGAAGPLRGPAMTVDGGVVREGLLAAQDAYADLLLEIREREPRHAELLTSRTAGWRDVARRLAPAEAFIEYLVSDSGSMAFVILRDTLAVVDLGIGRHELSRLVAFARGTVEAPRPAGDSLWRGPFRRLHRHLLQPVEEAGLLAGTTRLVIVPHAELHYLPFAALLSDRGVLVQRYELAVAPSATVWLTLGDRSPGSRGTGVLAMAPRSDDLPGSRDEVEAVRRLAGGEVRVLSGPRATEEAFLREAPGKRVLHLATYGVLNKHNPLFSFVEFAPGNSQDGRLEVHEVFALHLTADLVVLSACQTGLGSGRLADVPAGDDWVGLTRAFLHAGARSVVATLWAVDDRSTALLMEAFYRSPGAPVAPARALARAQRELLARPGTAHPFYWAGLVVAEGRGAMAPGSK